MHFNFIFIWIRCHKSLTFERTTSVILLTTFSFLSLTETPLILSLLFLEDPPPSRHEELHKKNSTTQKGNVIK